MNLRRDQTLTILVLTGLTAAFIGAVIVPGRHIRTSLSNEIAESEAEIARAPAILNKYRVTRRKLEAQRAYLRSSSESVSEPHGVLQTISRVAFESGFKVVRVEPVTLRTRATYVEHPFQLEFQTKLGALTRFLDGIESSDRLFVIEELTLRTLAGQADGETLEGTLRFSVYAATRGSTALAEENDSSTWR